MSLQQYLMAAAHAETLKRNERLRRMDQPPQHPGGIPGDLNRGGPQGVDAGTLRARIDAMLAAGPASRTAICEQCGNHRKTRDMLDAMGASGELRTWKADRVTWYEVPA